MKRKTTLLVVALAGVGIVTAAASGIATKPWNLFDAETDECADGQHVGNHYNQFQDDPTKEGVKEFYACCKCCHKYLPSEKPNGTWSAAKDLTKEEAEAIIELGDERKLPIQWVAENTNGKADKNFKYIGDGKFQIEKYTQDDFAYLRYTGEKSNAWAIEATISDFVNGITEDDIHNPPSGVEWFNYPIGLAGVNEKGAYSFGTLGSTQFNAFDSCLRLVNGGTLGDYINFGRNCGGGSGAATMIDLQNGFKASIIHHENMFFYLINDVYIGFNYWWLGTNMWEADSPALCTYKSGATYSNVKVYTGEAFTTYASTFYGNYSNHEAMFGTVYTDNTIVDYKDTPTKDAGQYWADTYDGGLFMTSDADAYVVRTTHSSTKYYFEGEINIEAPSAQWVRDGSFPWVGIGFGHVRDCDNGAGGTEARAMAPVPVIYQAAASTTAVTHQLNYIATPVNWEWQKVNIDATLAENIGTKYKAAVLRDGATVYYYINDQLVLSDTNNWNMGFDSNNPTTPMIYNAWGGAARVSNLKLLTDSAAVSAKLSALNA